MTDSLPKIAREWIKEHSSPNIDQPPDKRILTYWNKLTDLVCEQPEQAWHIILEIANTCDEEKVIANLAAGPLEDLLAFHGDRIISVIAEESIHNRRLRFLLGGVWRNNLSEKVWEVVQSLRSSSW